MATRMDFSKMEQEAADAKAELVEESGGPAEDTDAKLEEALTSFDDPAGHETELKDEDIPESNFWDGQSGNTDIRDNVLYEKEEVEGAEDTFESQLKEQIFKYKANGKDYEVDLANQDELAKKLSLAEGGAKAFSDKARLGREVKAKDEEIARLKEYEDLYKKLDKIKGNDREFVQEFLGKSYEEFEKEAARKYRIREDGTDEERNLLTMQEELSQMRQSTESDKRVRDLQEERSKSQLLEARQTRLKTAMEKEYFKHELPDTGNAAYDKKMSEMFWRESNQDVINALSNGDKLTNQLIQDTFKNNYNMLYQSHNAQVETTIKKRVETKRKKDLKQAQVDSQKNYATPKSLPSPAGHNPLSLFKAMKSRR